jgi:hypothetical protein
MTEEPEHVQQKSPDRTVTTEEPGLYSKFRRARSPGRNSHDTKSQERTATTEESVQEGHDRRVRTRRPRLKSQDSTVMTEELGHYSQYKSQDSTATADKAGQDGHKRGVGIGKTRQDHHDRRARTTCQDRTDPIGESQDRTNKIRCKYKCVNFAYMPKISQV